jgi:hypothetical protein
MEMDLTEAEEGHLPLPKAWVRALSAASNDLMYRNVSTGMEVMDHPYIIAATNAAKKLRLPDSWSAKVVTMDDGTEDVFYRNERAGISMWDHPLLRQCLASVLIDEGWENEAKKVMGELASTAGRARNNLVSALDVRQRGDESVEMQKSYDDFREAQKVEKESSNNKKIGFKKPNYLKDGHDNSLSKSFLGGRADEVNREYDSSTSPRGLDSRSDAEHSTSDARDRKVSFGDYFGSPESTSDERELRDVEWPRRESDSGLPNETTTEGEETAGVSSSAPESDAQSRDSTKVSREGSRESKDYNAESINEPEGGVAGSSVASTTTKDSNRFTAEPIKETGDAYGLSAGMLGNYLSNHAEMWNRYRNEASQDTRVDEEKTKSVADGSMPPESVAGVHVLTEDARLANERVHELLIQLRAKIATAEGTDCRVMQNDETTVVRVNGPQDMAALAGAPQTAADAAVGGAKKTIQDLTVLGADIMSELRHHPEYVISAMALCDPLATGMSQIAFTTLHRLLHPLSTDSSLTTLFLLQCINFQIEEIIAIGHLFPELDKKKLASRALYVSDPKTALHWNPLAQPLPVVPATQSETVLSCALRTYAIRRDVSLFFRCAWKPILHSISDVTKSSTVDGSRTWNNLVLTACRIIECTFNEAVITSWPPSATAVARSLFQIGGNDALHYYLFNYLILPNILRLLSGDHSGMENERTIRLDGIGAFSERYYNIDSWWPLEGIEKAPYNPVTALVWVLWKFYIGAALINQADIEVLYADDFFRGYPATLSTAGVKDKKLRIMLLRCQRRIDHGCQCLLRMPLDMHGSSFLNIDPETALRDLGDISQTIPKKSMEKRMASIVLKPRELVGLTIVGRHEIANIFSDVGVALEARGARAMQVAQENASPYARRVVDTARSHYADGEVPEGLTSTEASLFLAVSEYLLVNDAFGEERGEEFLVMPFQYKSENEPIDTLVTMIESNREALRGAMDGGGASVYSGESGTELDGDFSGLGRGQPFGYSEEKIEQQLALIDSMDRALGDAVKQRFSQLVVGLDLANRYEAALLSALECLDQPHSLFRNLILPAPLGIDVEDKISDTQNALGRLLGHLSWYDKVELDVDFVRDEAHYLERPTKASKSWVKPALNGLEPVKHVKLHPSALPGPNHYTHEDLFEDILDLKLDDAAEKGHQTHTQMQTDFFKSFRFNSAQKHVAASTSILDKGSTVKSVAHSKLRKLADKNRLKSKTTVGLSQVRKGRVVDEAGGQGGDTFIRTTEGPLSTSANGKSRYTKPVVDEASNNFMKKTKSHASREQAIMAGPEAIPADRKTHHQLTLDYFNSLRGGDGDDGYGNRRTADPNIKYSAYDGHAAMVDVPATGESKAQPFPEHLRHRIRGSKEAKSIGYAKMTNQGSVAAGSEGGEDAISARMAARRDMQELLGNYDAAFLHGSPPGTAGAARQDYRKPEEDDNHFDGGEDEDDDDDDGEEDTSGSGSGSGSGSLEDDDEDSDEYYDHGFDWGGEHATEKKKKAKKQKQAEKGERFSNFGSEAGSQASRAGSKASRASAGSGGSNPFEAFDIANVKDEDLPTEIPEDVPADEDIRAAWRHMSPAEKRKSIHYFFPKGSASYARWFGGKKGQKGQRGLPAPIKNTKFFQGGQIKPTKSSQARMRDPSKRSVYMGDAARGAIPGVRHDATHGFSSQGQTHAALQKSKKPPFRPAGIGGMDHTHAMMRELASRPKHPNHVPKNYRGVPKASFWGTHPHLSRSRMDKLFPAGAHPDPPFSPATDRAHYTKLRGQADGGGAQQRFSEFEDDSDGGFDDQNDVQGEDYDDEDIAEDTREDEDALSHDDFAGDDDDDDGVEFEEGVDQQEEEDPQEEEFSPMPETRTAPRPYNDSGNDWSKDKHKAEQRQRWNSMDRTGNFAPMGSPKPSRDGLKVADSRSRSRTPSKSPVRSPAPIGAAARARATHEPRSDLLYHGGQVHSRAVLTVQREQGLQTRAHVSDPGRAAKSSA